jgi:hypothetical protein
VASLWLVFHNGRSAGFLSKKFKPTEGIAMAAVKLKKANLKEDKSSITEPKWCQRGTAKAKNC